jgi:hypothetical protein
MADLSFSGYFSALICISETVQQRAAKPSTIPCHAQ